LTDQNNIRIVTGIDGGDRKRAAELYEEAFGAKLGIGIKSKDARLALLSAGFELNHAVTALQGNYLVGLAGFTTQHGTLTGGITYRKILREVGFFKGQWSAIILGLFERKARPGELLMDGIAVSSECRGQGIGTKLFAALIDYAKQNDYTAIRLDVIDTNPDAKRLYERLGFVAQRTNTFEVLRPLLGFGAATTMVFDIADSDS